MNLSNKEQQIENGKDVGGNKEAKKKDIQNERGRLNYQQSVSERETHRKRSRLSQERRREELSDTQIIIIKYS
jgi:hypothetical protein